MHHPPMVLRLFKKIFAGKSVDPEIDRMFQRLEAFLKSDALQNEALPKAIQAMLHKGSSVDKIEGATGDFGRCLTNPIPVNGAIGQVIYLSSLVKQKEFIFFHRLGSIRGIDVFETVTSDGDYWDILYLDMYHPRKSKLAPRGYDFHAAPHGTMIYGTTEAVEPFPSKIGEEISAWTHSMLGIPLVSPEIKIALENSDFIRPANISRAIDALPLNGRIPGILDARLELTIDHLKSQEFALSAIIKNSIGLNPLNGPELIFFSMATLIYLYLRYGPDTATMDYADKITRFVLIEKTEQYSNLDALVKLYQQRYKEYHALLNAVFQKTGFSQHDLITLMMHAVERVTGKSVQGSMIAISKNSVVLASMMQDSIDFAKGNLK